MVSALNSVFCREYNRYMSFICNYWFLPHSSLGYKGKIALLSVISIAYVLTIYILFLYYLFEY